MVFNKFCKITEKKAIRDYCLHDYKILKEAKLFEFNNIFGTKPKRKIVTPDNAKRFIYLPFPVSVFFNSDKSCDKMTIFHEDEHKTGFECNPEFIHVETLPENNDFYEALLIVRGGITAVELKNENIVTQVGVECLQSICPKTMKVQTFAGNNIKNDEQIFGIIKDLLHTTTGYFNNIIMMNSIENIIIESKSIKEKKGRKGKLKRVHERAEYVIIKSRNVRRFMGLPEHFTDEKTGRKRPYPHPVKAHERILDKGTERERVTHVRSYHTGKRESIKGNRIYKILLDPEDFVDT